jgi:hypothetical protein
MAAKLTYRVIRISEQTRQKFKQARDSQGLKNHQALEAILKTSLPLLVEGLAELGIIRSGKIIKVRAARLPFTSEGLDLLKSAADKSGLPQTILLKTALANVAPKRGRSPKPS